MSDRPADHAPPLGADDADLDEQRRAVVAGDPDDIARDEVPEADAADVEDQRRPVGGAPAPAGVRVAADVPEADAWEQALEVPLDDEADRP